MNLPAFRLLCALAGLVSLRPALAAESPIAPTASAHPEFAATILAATTRHLDHLLAQPDRLPDLKGKSAAGMTALAFFLTFEATGNAAYRAAALKIADDILADMKATKFGVLYIKEKATSSGEDISGGGPPALGWYVSALAHVYAHEKEKADELRYVAGVLDRFPWNEDGWWAATIDIRTGKPKQPLTKPSPINKNASLVAAAGVVARSLREIDPEMAARLAAKAKRCFEQQLVPAQEADGFWHYGLTGNDPKDKDVFGYFMLTMCELIQWREFGDAPRTPAFAAALEKSGGFARTVIAPMTDPNTGVSSSPRRTAGTPKHYVVADELKRGMQLGIALIGTGQLDEGKKIVEHALKHFPYGDRGQDGAQAVHATALIHHLLRRAAPGAQQAN